MRVLRRYLPKSLLWRTVLILVAPMVLLQAVVAYLIVQRHFDGVTRQMTEAAVFELKLLWDIADEAESTKQAKAELAAAAESLNIEVTLTIGATIPPNSNPMFFDVIGRAVEDTLRERTDRPLFVAIDREEKFVDIRAPTRFGVMQALMPRRRLVASNPHLLLTWMGAVAAVLLTVALLYLRNQIRPVQALAAAADAFGKGRVVPLRVAGAQEVRLAASAFLDMRLRIERQIEQRTRMLSGVSHDMRTPLTRMKLALEMMDGGAELDELRHDVTEMEHILEEFLAYARGDQGEAFVDVDVAALAKEVVTEARRKGANVSLYEHIETPGETRMTLRPRAIKRCLHNLLENALSYGSTAMLSLSVNRVFVEFAVEDDGPGIPPDQREQAFRPFNRLDEARNRNRASGVGLGLALALDAVRGHGGDLRLDDSAALGGLRATARLPR